MIHTALERPAACRWAIVITALGLLACGQAGDTPKRTSEQPIGTPPGGDGDGPVAGGPGVTPDAPVQSPDPSVPTGPIVKPTPDGACAARSSTAEQVVVEEQVTIEEEVTERVPVALYVMLDQSASMAVLWPDAVRSIEQFVQDPMSDGIEVALGYFPVDDSDCAAGTPYDTPEVPLGSLPGHAQAVIDNLAKHRASGAGTPTEGALRGVTSFCEGYREAHPDTRCVAVLISDGAPTDQRGTCAVDHATLTGVAGSSFAKGVMTYTVGLKGADFMLLDAIAEAGGTDCDPDSATAACDVTAGADRLVEALRSIRDEVVTVVTRTETVTHVVETPLPCAWQLPEPGVGQSLDFDRVNVQLSSPSRTPLTLGRVDVMAACAENGWYYDDNGQPTHIIACPETCQTIEATPQATIDILLDCKTVVLK